MWVVDWLLFSLFVVVVCRLLCVAWGYGARCGALLVVGVKSIVDSCLVFVAGLL